MKNMLNRLSRGRRAKIRSAHGLLLGIIVVGTITIISAIGTKVTTYLTT